MHMSSVAVTFVYIYIYMCMSSVAVTFDLPAVLHNNGRMVHKKPQLTSQQIEASLSSPAPQHQVTRPDTLPPERIHFNYFEEDLLDAYFARNASPTYIHNMLDMGFSRAQINLALDQ